MHVSQENNTYRLPRETFEAVLARATALSTTVSVAFQNRLVTHRVAFLQLHGVHAAGAAELAEDILVGGRLVGGVDAPVMGFDALLHGRSDEVVCQVARIQTEQLHLVARRSS